MTAVESLLGDDRTTVPAGLVLRNGMTVESCRARVVQPSEFRPVLHYAVSGRIPITGEPAHTVVIGKGYFRGGGAEVFDSMVRLWSEGFADDPALTIPEPLAYLEDRRLLLQSPAPGRALYQDLDAPASALGRVRLAARWLAKLHAGPLAGIPVVAPAQEREKLSVHRSVLTDVCPQVAPRIDRLAEFVAASSATQSPRDGVPTHGDFQPKNIFVSGERVTVIDFDRFGVALPARDLGHFVAQSLTMSCSRTGSFDQIASWNAAFLDEYLRLRPSDALSALGMCVVRSFLEILYYKLFVKPVSDPSFVPEWLDECERWIGRAG